MSLRIHWSFVLCGVVALLGIQTQHAHAQWADIGAVVNGSFEVDTPYVDPADVDPPVGYVSNLTGWTVSGSNHILNDDSGPFYIPADNGPIPRGEQVAGIQGEGTLSQTLTGLDHGEEYRLDFYYNLRDCCDFPNEGEPYRMWLQVSIGTELLYENVVEVTSSFVPVREVFVYDSAWGDTLEIVTFDPENDATILYDGFAIMVESTLFPPAPSGTPVAGPLGIAALLSGIACGGAILIHRRRRKR